MLKLNIQLFGGRGAYLKKGGFSRYDYEKIEITANGIKVIKKKADNNHNTPSYSNTPYTAYAIRDPKTGKIKQVATYGGENGRQKLKDIDTDHIHENKKRKKVIKTFSEKEIHVHDYVNGKRSALARKPSKKERRLLMMARYGVKHG